MRCCEIECQCRNIGDVMSRHYFDVETLGFVETLNKSFE